MAVTAGPTTALAPGHPRSDSAAAFIKRFEPVMRLPIVVSAILPLIIVPESGGWVGVVVGVLTRLVFLVDYVVHERCLYRYGRTRLGLFDLAVVVLTAPWFRIPGFQPGRFVVLLRLARLVRLVVATRGSRRLLDRVAGLPWWRQCGGRGFTGGRLRRAPLQPGFATPPHAFWWGIVTLTTVGYGDIVPKTPTGRWAGVMIMVTYRDAYGLAVAAHRRLAVLIHRPDREGGMTGPDRGDVIEGGGSRQARKRRPLTDNLSCMSSPRQDRHMAISAEMPKLAPHEHTGASSPGPSARSCGQTNFV